MLIRSHSVSAELNEHRPLEPALRFSGLGAVLVLGYARQERKQTRSRYTSLYCWCEHACYSLIPAVETAPQYTETGLSTLFAVTAAVIFRRTLHHDVHHNSRSSNADEWPEYFRWQRDLTAVQNMWEWIREQRRDAVICLQLPRGGTQYKDVLSSALMHFAAAVVLCALLAEEQHAKDARGETEDTDDDNDIPDGEVDVPFPKVEKLPWSTKNVLWCAFRDMQNAAQMWKDELGTISLDPLKSLTHVKAFAEERGIVSFMPLLVPVSDPGYDRS